MVLTVFHLPIRIRCSNGKGERDLLLDGGISTQPTKIRDNPQISILRMYTQAEERDEMLFLE